MAGQWDVKWLLGSERRLSFNYKRVRGWGGDGEKRSCSNRREIRKKQGKALYIYIHTYIYMYIWFKGTNINGNKLWDRKKIKIEWIIKGTEKRSQEVERYE